MLRFEYSSYVDAPVAEVFSFHEREDALEILTPPDPPVEVVRREGGIRPGAVVELRIGRWPFRMTWLARHAEFQQDRHFVDVQERGPFAHWEHRHEFAPEGSGTRMTDRVTFSLPLGFVANPLFGGLATRQLRKMFAHRHAQVRRYVGLSPDAARDAARPGAAGSSGNDVGVGEVVSDE